MSKGNQTVNWKVGTKLDPETLGRAVWHVFPAGIYHGGSPSVDDVDTLKLPPFEAIIRDDGNSVSAFISTDEDVFIDANENSPYFVIGWTFNDTENNYAYFDIRSQGDIKSHEIKICKGQFDGNGDLTGVSTDVPNDRDEQYLDNVQTPLVISDVLKLSDQDGDNNLWTIEEDSGDGHLHISHPDLSGDIILRQDGTIETDGKTGDPGSDDRLVPRKYADDLIDPLVFPDKDGDSDQWKVEEDDGDGHLHISHPEFGGDIILRQDGRVATSGRTGNPGSDDRLVPRGYVDSQLSSKLSEGDFNSEKHKFSLGSCNSSTVSLNKTYSVGIPVATIYAGCGEERQPIAIEDIQKNGNNNIDAIKVKNTYEDASASVIVLFFGIVA